MIFVCRYYGNDSGYEGYGSSLFQDKLPHHSYEYTHPEIQEPVETEVSPPVKEQKVEIKPQVRYSVSPSVESAEFLFLLNSSEP